MTTPETPPPVCAECAHPIDAASGSALCGPCWSYWDAVELGVDSREEA